MKQKRPEAVLHSSSLPGSSVVGVGEKEVDDGGLCATKRWWLEDGRYKGGGCIILGDGLNPYPIKLPTDLKLLAPPIHTLFKINP